MALHHPVLGGTTTATVRVYWLGKEGHFPPTPPLQPIALPARSVGTLVNSVLPGKSHPRPAAKRLKDGVGLLSSHPPTYDSRGCFPVGLAHDTLFLVPSVRNRHTGWVVRTLNSKELLLSVDLPVSWITQIPTDSLALRIWTLMSKFPLKLLLGGARAVLVSRGISDLTVSRRGLSKKLDEILVTEVTQEEGLTLGRVNLLNWTDATRDAKMAKADDSGIPVYLWDDRLWSYFPDAFDRTQNTSEDDSSSSPSVLDVLRSFMFRYWQRKLFREWWTIVNKNNSLSLVDLDAGRDCIRRGLASSWWTWDNGSRCFPWRWPKFYQKTIRDGLQIWRKQKLKPWFRAQPRERDGSKRVLIATKINVIRIRRYITHGNIESCISYFDVPKAITDVRMVYDGTKSGLNDTLWVPRFTLPTVESHLRATMPGYFMADLDIGEMFHNFMLDVALRSQCGIDITPYYPQEVKKRGRYLRLRWERLLMGLLPSPYAAYQAILVARVFLLGDPDGCTNPFRWDEVRLNLPGDGKYNPSVPWVAKFRATDDKVATDLFIYVDDVRVTASDEESCWNAARQVAGRLGYLGIQDASRKRQGPSQTPEPWAGSVVYTSDTEVYVLVSEEKWKKTKEILARIQDELSSSNDGMMCRKQLERDRGFLIYVCRTYSELRPYLKGMHLTLDSWREGRDDAG